jgi:hypothetical protein
LSISGVNFYREFGEEKLAFALMGYAGLIGEVEQLCW